MQPKRTSKEPIPSSSCQRGSSSSSVHLVLLLVFMFLLVYPLAATPLFPQVSLFRRKARVVCTIGTSPLSTWWWVVDACTLFTTPITVSARTCQQWQVPLVDGRRAIYGLHGVAANGLTISVCCTCMLCKMWRNCGWRWDKIKTILLFYLLRDIGTVSSHVQRVFF